MGGRWHYKLLVSLYDLYNADISEIMGGRWRYNLLVSLNFTNCTMQTYQNSWVDAGVTNV